MSFQIKPLDGLGKGVVVFLVVTVTIFVIFRDNKEVGTWIGYIFTGLLSFGFLWFLIGMIRKKIRSK